MRRRALAPLAALLAFACDGGVRTYDRNDLELAPAYTAKEVCSCLFVMEQTEEYCTAWTRASPNVAQVVVDHDQKRVVSPTLLFWGASARWVGPKFGCVLED